MTIQDMDLFQLMKRRTTHIQFLDGVSPKNFDKMNRLLIAKDDEEIVKLKDELAIMSAHWKLKTQDLESQV